MGDQINRLERKLDDLKVILMSFEADLKADLDAIQLGVATAMKSIADLQAQIAALIAGTPVTQAQLDALVTQADAIKASLAPPATV